MKLAWMEISMRMSNNGMKVNSDFNGCMRYKNIPQKKKKKN